MTFQRRLSLVALLAMLVTLTPAANGATIAGTKCTKVGATKTTGGLKHFCVKSGKNLVWNKGTKVKSSASASPTTGLIKLTLDEVKKHNDSTSCWSIVYTNVFDLTKWITKHPGGAEKIRAICGKDGTSSFERQHEGDGGAANQLSSYFLGKVGDSIKG